MVKIPCVHFRDTQTLCAPKFNVYVYPNQSKLLNIDLISNWSIQCIEVCRCDRGEWHLTQATKISNYESKFNSSGGEQNYTRKLAMTLDWKVHSTMTKISSRIFKNTQNFQRMHFCIASDNLLRNEIWFHKPFTI